MTRLFVAVWPPEDVIEQLAVFDRPEVAGLRWTPREQWHITLRFLGRVDDVDAARSALRAMDVGGVGAVLATMGPATGRFGRRVLHVPVGGLDAVAGAVVAATRSVGEAPDPRPFHGHLTLARARDRRGVDLRDLAGRPLAASWPVREVTIVESHLGGGPARYEVVESVALSS